MTPFKLPADIRWIGPERVTEQFPIETSYFKTVFNLPAVPPKAEISISANTRYLLFVNGQEILNGPCRGDHWHQFCDVVDIAPYLTAGKNVIAAKVVSFVPYEASRQDNSNAGPFWAMSNAAGPMLLCWGEFLANNETTDISTGRADWFYLNDSAITWKMQNITFWMGCSEDVDASKLPKGWETSTAISPAFSPAKIKWGNTIEFGEIPPLRLFNRPIKHLLRLEKDLPFENAETEITIPANTTKEILLDTKQLTTSFVYFHCNGGLGSTVTFLYSEAFSKFDGKRNYKGVRSDASGELRGIVDIYRPSGANEIYSPSWFRTLRFMRLTIQTGNEPLTIYPIKLVETRYPLQDKITFTHQEPWVQKVWDISRRTLELCMHETYEDCPFYEQLQYTMDTRLQILFTYAISNDSTMAQKTLHDYHTSILPEGILLSRFPSKYHQVIPMFSLHWIFMLKDYYTETGDIATLERYRPTVESILAWYKRQTGQQGLVEYLPYWDFADWTETWDDIAGTARASLHGPSTIQNLVYAYALEVGASIMEDLDIETFAKKYRAERSGILQNVEKLCWSTKKKLYREGPAFEEYTQHAQMWAVLNKLAVGEKAKMIMTTALSDKTLIPCSFVMQYFMFRALEEADMYEETKKLWPMWKELLDLDLTTVPEIPGQYTRSDCHAWGSLILHELPRKFLGVMPIEPGYSKITIRPMGMFMKAMSGTVPTPHGDVKVEWTAENGKFTIKGSTPVLAEVILPSGARSEIKGEFALTENM